MLILVLGFGLRLLGLNWDDGIYLHPDERHIVADVLVGRISLSLPTDPIALLDPDRSTLNPRPFDAERGSDEGFAYGTLPLYMTDLTAELLSWLTDTDWHLYGHVHLVGRALSLLLDTATILLTFILARFLVGDGGGLIAALCYALAPMAVQLAHFFTAESWITFFVTLSLIGAVQGARGGAARHFALAGAAAGLAIASKSSVAGIIVPTMVAVGWDGWQRLLYAGTTVATVNAVLARATVAAVSCLVMFALGEPFALLDVQAYVQSLRLQLLIQSGSLDVPFTRQYVGTLRGWYQLEQLVRWGLGPAVGGMALIGTVLLVYRFTRYRHRTGATSVLVSWLAIYGLAILLPESKFLRYLSPLLPVLAVGAGLLWVTVSAYARRHGWHRPALVGLGVCILAALGWNAAVASIYVRPHPRLAASSWLFEHAAPGSATTNEVWDDRLPISSVPGLDAYSRRIDGVEINLYRDYPTYGDARELAVAFATHPHTQPLGTSIEQHAYAKASSLLRGSLVPQLFAMDSTARVALSGNLSRAATRMTTSGELQAATLAAARSLLRPDVEGESNWLALASVLGSLPESTAEGQIYDVLSRSDYYVLSSNRVLTGIERAPWRYPVQQRFYDLLFAEALGFRLVEEFTSHPQLGGFVFADDSADESFINYDHPHVWVFKKEQLIDRAAFARLVAPASLQQTTPERSPPDQERLMLDRPVSELPVVDDARWSAVLTDNSWWALLVWIALLVALQLAGAPLASIIFASFPDRGWAAARLLALLTAGWIVWLLSSIQAIAFRAIWCALALALVAGTGWWVQRWFLRAHPRSLHRKRGRLAVASEAVFWATFVVFLLFRYLNPDSWHPYWGGEKPMEFAHLNATLRSAHFPPYDPWYAGGYLNYYYYGTYLVAFAIKLTGIPSEIAFNLAQPTVIALLAALSFSVAAAVGTRLTRRPALVLLGGLAGVFFVSIAGNLLAASRVLQSLREDTETTSPWSYWVWDAREVIPFTINEFPYFTALYADLHAHVVAWPITLLVMSLAYTIARDQRLLLLVGSSPRRFPRSALLTALRLSMLGLSLGALAPTNAWDVATYAALTLVAIIVATERMRSLMHRTLIVAGIALGLAAFAVLAYLPFHLHYVALFRTVDAVEVEATTPLDSTLLHLGAFLAVLFVGVITLAMQKPGAARIRWLNPAATLSVVAVAFIAVRFTRMRAPEYEELALGAGILVVALILIAVVSGSLSRLARSRSARLTVGVTAMASIIAVLVTFQSGRPTMALYLAFGCAALVGWLFWDRPTERFLMALVAGGAFLGATLEILYLVDNLVETPFYRMNTVFKFYNQIWVLFAIASGALVALMADRGIPSLPASSRVQSLGFSHSFQTRTEMGPAQGWGRAGIGVAMVVVLLTLAYPLTATLPRLETRFSEELGSGTLNALDWMNDGTVMMTNGETLAFDEDRAVVDWFNSEVEGTPVLAEAAFGSYRCNGSRISIATGLPAVIGWQNHETQQRDADDLGVRERDLRTLYTDADVDEKQAIIDRYGIDYIVVGELERAYPRLEGSSCAPDGSAAGTAAFEEMVGSTLRVAFQAGNTVVYRVV